MTADETTPRGENEKPDVPANDEQTQKRRTITNFEVKKLLEAAIVLMQEIRGQSNLGNLADTHTDPPWALPRSGDGLLPDVHPRLRQEEGREGRSGARAT